MNFPEIAFNYQKTGNIGIESIRLKDLYSRTQVIEPASVERKQKINKSLQVMLKGF